jgi:hypothetical protein
MLIVMPVRPGISFVELKPVAVAALKLRTLLVALGTPLGVQFAGLFQFAPADPVQSRVAGAVRSSRNSVWMGENARRLCVVVFGDCEAFKRRKRQDVRAIEDPHGRKRKPG